MADIVFIHGWGEDPRIWGDLSPLLPAHNHHFIDLGFIGGEEKSSLNLENPTLYITHSLGTMWALKHTDPKDVLGLIAINGFACFEEFTSPRTLQAMGKGVKRSTAKQMRSFWENCNLPENMQELYEQKLNRDALSQGLSWLSHWDMRKKLQELKALNVPVLSLGGMQDAILPINTMQTHWKNMEHDVVIKQEAGHALPLSHPDWCASKIEEFRESNL